MRAQSYWHVPIFSAFERLRQGDSNELSQPQLHSRRPCQKKKVMKIRYGELRDSEQEMNDTFQITNTKFHRELGIHG